VAALGAPITAPSANPHGAASPRTADEVVAGLAARVDLVLDGGSTPGGPASTVLDLTRAPAAILRAGAIAPTPEDLEG
jgi:L-threonylcarbamoyladenylate synthase